MRSLKQTGVKIDITDDGAVSICGTDADRNGAGNESSFIQSLLTLRPDRFWKVKSSASKSLEHSLSLHQVKKEWYTFLKFQKKE